MGKIYSNGTATFTVAANEKVAAFSYSAMNIYKQVGYPNQPSAWVLLIATGAGDSYTSSAFTAATVVRIDASASDAFYETGSAPVIGDPTPDISAADSTFTIAGLAAAQGGYVATVGGTSSTSANAGGAVTNTGGVPGATGVGGASTVAGGAGGATSGAGGVASCVGGAGTAGNSAGGVSKNVGGAGQGSAAGGKGQITGGIGGATGVGGTADVTGGAGGATSGKGGAANVTGGAGTNGNASGGSVILSGGAKNGSGLDGGVINRGTFQMRKQPTPGTATATATLTVAQMLGGILTANPGAAVAYTMPTGTALLAALPTDIAADDSFDIIVQNIAATTNWDITWTASTDITIVGDAVVRPTADSGTEQAGQGTFRLRYVSGVTFVAYRIS